MIDLKEKHIQYIRGMVCSGYTEDEIYHEFISRYPMFLNQFESSRHLLEVTYSERSED